MDDLIQRRKEAKEARLLALARELHDGYELYGDERFKWARDVAMLTHMVLTMDVRDEVGGYSKDFVRAVTMLLTTATKVGTDGGRESVVEYGESMFKRIMPGAFPCRVWHPAHHHLTPKHFHLDDAEDLHDLLDVFRVHGGFPDCCMPEEYRHDH